MKFQSNVTVFLLILLCLSPSFECKRQKRQEMGGPPGPMDFVNSIMRMLMPANGEPGGGPGGAISGIFMGLINQTQGLLGPLMGGMGGMGGDPSAMLSGIIQQVMGMVNQMTMMWSNTVASQMTTWEHVMPMDSGNSKAGREYEALSESVKKMRGAQSEVMRLQQIERKAKYSGEKMDEPSFNEMWKVHAESAKNLMENVWKNLREIQSGISINTTVPFFESFDINTGNPDIRNIVLDLQKEMNELWKSISKEINDQLFPNKKLDGEYEDGAEGEKDSRLNFDMRLKPETEKYFKERVAKLEQMQSGVNGVISGLKKSVQTSSPYERIDKLRESLRGYINNGTDAMAKKSEEAMSSVQVHFNRGVENMRNNHQMLTGRIKDLINAAEQKRTR